MITVTVYSTGPGCVRCTLACRCLAAASIPFSIIDLTDDRNAAHREFVTDELGYSEAPVVLVDGDAQHHWSGFRPDLIDQLAAVLAPGSER